MQLFKQALIQYKEQWKESLLIGLLALLCVMAAPYVPLVGSFVLSLVLLVFQSIVWFWQDRRRWPKPDDLLPQIVVPLLVCSLVMTPTSILIGSAHGLLASPQDYLTSWPVAIGLLFIGLYFYFLIAHSLLITLKTENLGIAKALDQAALDSVKRFKEMTPLCLVFAFLFLICQILYGALWFLILPLLFYSTIDTLKKQNGS